jgi:hypothetical protein
LFTSTNSTPSPTLSGILEAHGSRIVYFPGFLLQIYCSSLFWNSWRFQELLLSRFTALERMISPLTTQVWFLMDKFHISVNSSSKGRCSLNQRCQINVIFFKMESFNVVAPSTSI